MFMLLIRWNGVLHFVYEYSCSRAVPATNKGHGKGLFANNDLTNDQEVVFRKSDSIIECNGNVLTNV